jgi:hypothetical protein
MQPIVSKLIGNLQSNALDANSTGEKREFINGGPSKFDQVLQQSQKAASPQRLDELGESWKTQGAELSTLAQRLSALPKTTALDQIRNSFDQLDSEYRRLGSAIDGISPSAGPEQLLKLQREMYQMSESIGAMSKIVDQVTSGVKSLLQTQI